MGVVSVAGRWVNKVVAPVVLRCGKWPENGRTSMAVVSYSGRKSGREFTLVVAIRRTESGATIAVELPDQKRWWRNFLQPGPLTIDIGGDRRTGRARAVRDDGGKVRIHVELD
ncbi:hypothetical protein [Saccharopolyspora sp. 6V]|uniref:hypothetical protein n=1 Tax=Saccharopolyspora sp. 6V TaxID=2877239 RepID=UPI001CD75FA7|nr:hypothetical protein [Saccharopolyspora sp. 6V]MCA1193672.1 hypothetical protein [Saccharopolyspora sp. 6V]